LKVRMRQVFYAFGVGAFIGSVTWYLTRSLPQTETENKRYFYLFGSPISKSPSPTLHNAGFEYYHLPYQYKLCDTLDINEVVKTIKYENTLGGSVTIPHKEAIIPFLDQLTTEASEIGAVNTVYKIERDGKKMVVGDNTDWIAIHTLATKRLTQAYPNTDITQLCGLVIGAGGTAHAACYALSKLGIPFYIWNRTFEKAEKLSKDFRGKPCSRLEDLPANSVDIVIGTVPSDIPICTSGSPSKGKTCCR